MITVFMVAVTPSTVRGRRGGEKSGEEGRRVEKSGVKIGRGGRGEGEEIYPPVKDCHLSTNHLLIDDNLFTYQLFCLP